MALFLWVVCTAGCLRAADEATAPMDIRDAARAAAKRFEEIMEQRGKDGGGLLKRVEEILSHKPAAPAGGNKKGARLALLKEVRLPPDNFIEFRPGIVMSTGTAFWFNLSREGLEFELAAMEASVGKARDPLPILFRMSVVTHKLGDDGRAMSLAVEAEKQARRRVHEMPQSADAHAWLAQILGWKKQRAEMLSEIQQALTLDPKWSRALTLRANEETAFAAFELQPGGASENDMPEMARMLRRIYEDPPDDARVAAMERRIREAEALYREAIAHSPDDPEPRFQLMAGRLAFGVARRLAQLLREGRPSTFEDFTKMQAVMETSAAKEMLADADDLFAAAEVAPADPQIQVGMGVLALMGSGTDSRPRGEIPQNVSKSYEEAMHRAEALLQADDPAIAAKACEAVFLARFTLDTVRGKRGVPSSDLAARAVKLDPWRVLALDGLMAASTVGDPAATRALAEIRLAAADNADSHIRCAGASAKLGDWADSKKQLEAALKHEPGSVRIMVWFAGVSMMADQDKGTLAGLVEFYEKIKDAYREQYSSTPADVVEALLVNYTVLSALDGHWPQAREVLEGALKDGRVREEAAKPLLSLMPE
jgi:tetratricopeptide (TPR) repeat protein